MTDIDKERAAMCALNRIYGYAPALSHMLIDTLESARAIFDMDTESRRQVLGPYFKKQEQLIPEELERSGEELLRLRQKGIEFVTIKDNCYPSLLKECQDSPIGLYVRSHTKPEILFNPEKSISIVGTRDLSPYGDEWCRRIIQGIAARGRKVLVVSGFALGTDITAHSTALNLGIPTIGVLPTGIDLVYPSRHWKWAEKMVGTEACGLITDYPPGMTALAINFVRRNRIIAGLSESTILIESKRKGGGMITAEFAFSYNRSVFALPGRIDDLRSQGCNQLIHRKMAEPIDSVETLMAELGLTRTAGKQERSVSSIVKRRFSGILSEEDMQNACRIVSTISSHRDLNAEEISASSSCPYSETVSLLSLIEAEGIINADLLGRYRMGFTI